MSDPVIGVREMYNAFCKEEHAKPDGFHISYRTFRDILLKGNNIVLDKMINDGMVFNLGYKIGKVSIKRAKRYYNKKNRNINWHESKKLSKELGEWTPVYFTSTFKLFFNFEPARAPGYKRSQIRCLDHYWYRPTAGNGGLVRRAYRACRQDETLINKYKEKEWQIYPLKAQNE